MEALPPELSSVKDTLLNTNNNNLPNARRLLRSAGKKLLNTKPEIIMRIGGDNRRRTKHPAAHNGNRPCSYCKIKGHTRSECRSRKYDEQLGYFLPNRDAPWKANMEEAIKKVEEFIDKYEEEDGEDMLLIASIGNLSWEDHGHPPLPYVLNDYS